MNINPSTEARPKYPVLLAVAAVLGSTLATTGCQQQQQQQQQKPIATGGIVISCK